MEESTAASNPELALDEFAVLCAISAGASFDEIEQILGDRDAASRIVGELERRGLLALTSSPSPSALGEGNVAAGWGFLPETTPGEMLPSPTAVGEGLGVRVLSDHGRQYLLRHISTWTRSASKLEQERAHLERLRTDLLSTISHELRTPLTLIRTSIGLLLDSEPDEEMQRRLLRNIKQSTDRMHLLVTDLLDLARIRGDRFELQMRRVDVGRLVNEAVALMRPLLDAKQQQAQVVLPATPAFAPGDYRRLERVLLNLLGNANKFAEAGTRLVVTVHDRADEVQITVRDGGPGIPAAAMPHLFEQFFTARTSSSRYNIGAGLGLPIAKGIIEAHRGRIWVESVVGEGAAVSFALPKSWPEERGDEGPGR